MSEERVELSDEAKALAESCNEKHVRVVQAILSGEFDSNTEAYISVYGVDTRADSARANVARMLAIDSVKALHFQLREEKLLEGVLTRAEAMKILSDMASTPISDLVDFGVVEAGVNEDGIKLQQSVWKLKDSALLSDSAMRSISELAATRDGLKIKQHDQKAAIKQLAEMAGWDAAKEVKVTGLEVAGDLLYRKDGRK